MQVINPEKNYLCEDVINLILELLVDKVTLLTKKLRNSYFEKFGIWLHLIDFAKDYVSTIPENFYRYPVNLDTSGMIMSSIFSTKYYLREIFKNIEWRKLYSYLAEKTIYIKSCRTDFLDCFGNNVKNVSKMKGYITNVGVYEYKNREGNKISGLRYVLGLSSWNVSLTDKRIADAIWECNISRIDANTFYPNLEKLSIGSIMPNNIVIKNLKSENFPKLRKFSSGWCFLEKLSQIFSQVDKLAGTYDHNLTHQIYESIVLYNYSIRIILHHSEMLKKILGWARKFGPGNITIDYKYSQEHCREDVIAFK